MTGQEHYEVAESILAQATDPHHIYDRDGVRERLTAAAQVHATLAMAYAVRNGRISVDVLR